MGILVKIHKSEHTDVVAVCDIDLLGKTLEDKERKITISEKFYGGEEMSEEEAIPLLQAAANINIIGEEAIATGIRAGVIAKENIVIIQGIPHAQVYAI